MNIVFDAGPAILQRGGISRYAREVAERLVRGRCADRITLVAPGWGGRAGATSPGGWKLPADVRRLDASPRRHRLRLFAGALAGRPDDRYWGRPTLLHSPDAFAPVLRDARTIVTVHDLSFRLLPECHTLSNRIFLESLVGRSLRRAAAVLAVSENTRFDLERHFGVPRDRVRVVYPGVTRAIARPAEDAARATARRLGIARPFVLAVGTLEPRKNHLFLLDAFARLVAGHGYQGELVVVGRRGWGRVPLHRRAAALGLSDRVRLLGWVEDRDLGALYAACDVMALPSLYEGFGLQVVEALACGAPVLVSDRGALPEVAGAAGRALPVDDPARWAAGLAELATPEARARAGRLGPLHTAAFDFDRTARGIEELYDELGG